MSLAADSPTANSHASPSPEPNSHPVIEVKGHLTYFKRLPPTNGKGKGREEKDDKKKSFQFEFIPGEDGYVGLLRALLAKYGETKYRVQAKKPFGIKALVPPDRA